MELAFILAAACVLAPLGVYIMVRLGTAAYYKSRNQFNQKDQ